MFGWKGKQGTVSLKPDDLHGYSDTQLRSLFIQSKWASLDKATRLAALQEIENRRAAIDGRPPLPVIECNSDAYINNPGLMGSFIPSLNVIQINYRFLEGNSPFHVGTQALETVLHEGRHAFQHFVVQENPDKVAKQVFCEWLSSMTVYFSVRNAPEELRDKIRALYMLQAIESDARRFARREMAETFEAFQREGLDTRDLDNQLGRNLQQEFSMFLMVKKYLSLKEIDDVEKMVLNRMEKQYPHLDLSKSKLFDNARFILKYPLRNIQDFYNLVAQLDVMIDQKLDANVDKSNRARIDLDFNSKHMGL